MIGSDHEHWAPVEVPRRVRDLPPARIATRRLAIGLSREGRRA